MLLHLLMLILGASVTPDCFRPNPGPLCHPFRIRFCFRCLYCIHKQFEVPLSRQIALGPTLGRFVTHPISDSILDACIISMDRIRTRYLAEVKCYSERGKILTAKYIDDMPIYPSCTRFSFLI